MEDYDEKVRIFTLMRQKLGPLIKVGILGNVEDMTSIFYRSDYYGGISAEY